MVVFGFSKVISFEMEQGSRACGVVSCPTPWFVSSRTTLNTKQISPLVLHQWKKAYLNTNANLLLK